MNELQRIVENIQSVFEESDYPRDFLEAYDQMECLANHSGRETFLIRKKESGEMAVAKCYDRRVFPFQSHPVLPKNIEHPGLPGFSERYQNDHILCVVREYIEGEPLSDFVKDKQLTMQQILSFGEQLCDILSVLHGHIPPIIHRDIKPENIIVRPDETLVLIDFDISRSYKEKGGSDTVFFGTKGYAPPEQYGFGQTDNRTDIYALGVLLRWMVTGVARENANVTMDAGMQTIIDRCTAFSPDERYDSVDQIRQDLHAAQTNRRNISPKKVWIGAILLLAMLCCGFAMGRYTDWMKPSPHVSFSEPVIEQAVRMQLGKESGTLTEEDLAQVRQIYIYGNDVYTDPELFYQQTVEEHAQGPIRTLDDLKLLPNLEEVNISRQGYVDISGLADLTQLYTVQLKHMRISGVQPIAHISKLKHAILFDCGLTEVGALENCPWLETLDIGLNNLTDLTKIGSHPNVRALCFMWLKMKDVDEIARRFPKLEAITLQHSFIKDLSGLKSLPKLEAVYVLQEQFDTVSELFAGTDVEIHVTEN